MKTNLTGMALLLALLVALFPATTTAQSAPITNGSFETGDYTGWTLWESSGKPAWGTWGIASDKQVIKDDDTTFDFCDNVNVVQSSAGLPIKYRATDGQYLAYQLQSGPQDHRMYQNVTIPASGGFLSWDMFYQNQYGVFEESQYLAIHIRDTSDNILETIFKTVAGNAQSISMRSFSHDMSAYAGTTIRIDVELKTRLSCLDAGFDNFRIAAQAPPEPSEGPPGWDKGKKSGWDDSIPPGISKKDKTPPGFDEGNKSW